MLGDGCKGLTFRVVDSAEPIMEIEQVLKKAILYYFPSQGIASIITYYKKQYYFKQIGILILPAEQY